MGGSGQGQRGFLFEMVLKPFASLITPSTAPPLLHIFCWPWETVSALSQQRMRPMGGEGFRSQLLCGGISPSPPLQFLVWIGTVVCSRLWDVRLL